MTELSRRALIQGAGVVAAALPAALLMEPDAAFAATATTRASFTPYKGQLFDVRAGQVRTRMKLVGIEDLDVHNRNHPRRFRLVFTGPTGARVRSATYRFSRAKFGTMSVFVVPTNKAGQYVATFNGL